MHKKVLIIGNGFDLDLGLKSTYLDFMESELWKSTYAELKSARLLQKGNILTYLESKKNIEKWFDVETELLHYALERSKNGLVFRYMDQDKELFKIFCAKLKDYLKLEENRFTPKDNPIAVQLIRAILDNGYFNSIYSFNYTDISIVLGRMGVNINAPIHYVHGSLREGDDIILGIETDLKIRSEYTFLYKSNSKFYSSNELINDLKAADDVVFFGHSINGMDFPYFENFFLDRVQQNDNSSKKRITIFTKDSDSDTLIRDNFRDNKINPRTLMLQNVVSFIETEGLYKGEISEKNKYKEFLNHLEDESEKADQAIIDNIESYL